jgi:hypothetical protein
MKKIEITTDWVLNRLREGLYDQKVSLTTFLKTINYESDTIKNS